MISMLRNPLISVKKLLPPLSEEEGNRRSDEPCWQLMGANALLPAAMPLKLLKPPMYPHTAVTIPITFKMGCCYGPICIRCLIWA